MRRLLLRDRLRPVARAVVGVVVLLIVLALLASRAEGQAAPAASSAESALLDSARAELVRARGFQRASETQLSKVLALLDSLLARGPGRVDTVRIVVRDTVRDTVWLPEPPREPEPPTAARDSIIAWSVTLEPHAEHVDIIEGDTLRVRIVAGGVTAVTPTGARVQRAATWDEIRAAGFTWIHSGLGARRDPAPDGTAITFVATQASAQWPTTHLSAMWRDRVVGRVTVRTLARLPGDPPPTTPEPHPPAEPIAPPPPCEGECTPAPMPGLERLAEFGADYACARLVEGTEATVVGDTIRVALASSGSVAHAWCIPYNLPAVTEGDPYRARTYPAEPHAERPRYRVP